jgi:hypothetical protein
VVEQTFAMTEQDGHDVEHEFVDRACRERLPHSRCAAGDGDVAVAGGSLRLREGRVEACCDEVERRPALHLYRLVGVVGKDERRRLVGRLVAPPAAPVLVPLTPG